VRSTQSKAWQDEGRCPSCGRDPLEQPCPHLAAAYDETFPSPNGESLCPVELGGEFCKQDALDSLTSNLLSLLLAVKQKRGAVTVVRKEIALLSQPLRGLIEGTLPTRKCVRAEAEEDGRIGFDQYALFGPFRLYVNAVFDAAPGANGSGSGEAGGPGFTSSYHFLWSKDAAETTNAATAVFRDDAAKVAELLISLQNERVRRRVN
jgi:hypothetical protein